MPLKISVWLGSGMIGLFCNYTSQESHGPMSMVKNSDVLTLSRALLSELIIYNTRQGDFYTCTMARKSDNEGDDVMQG